MAILDTGAYLAHSAFGPDLNSDGIGDRIVYQFDFSGTNDSNASDFNGHGTNMAGIEAGLATGANLIILKVFPDSGAGASNADIEEALQWVVAHHAEYNIVSVNMSLGSGNYSTTVTSPYSDELALLDAARVLTVTASGNSFQVFGSAQGVAYPAADVSTISVGATFDANVGGPLG